MRRILHLALHDTRLFVMARESLFYMFIMPVLFILFFSVVFRASGPEQVKVSLQVVDADGGFLGEAFVAQLGSEQFDVTVLTPAEADTTDFIRRLTIPAGFTDSLLVGRRVALPFVKNADSNLEYDAAAEVRLHQAQASFLSALIGQHMRTGGPPTEAALPELLALINAPARVTVDESYAGTGRPVPSGAGQSIPGMLTMFVVMVVMIGGSESLTREKQAGTLARLATTTLSRGEIITGKLLHLSLVGLIQALVLMAAGQVIGAIHLFGIEFSWGADWWVIAVFAVPYGISVACVTLFISGLFRTTQQAESLAWLIGMVFAAMGGCMWPIEFMPAFTIYLAHLFPTYWAMQALHGVVTFGRGADVILLPSLVVLAYGLLFGWLGARTMRVAR